MHGHKTNTNNCSILKLIIFIKLKKYKKTISAIKIILIYWTIYSYFEIFQQRNKIMLKNQAMQEMFLVSITITLRYTVHNIIHFVSMTMFSD